MSEHAFMRALGLREENLTSTCEGADVIIAVGVLPSRDNSALTCELKTSVEKGSKLVYLFTMEDPEITPKSTYQTDLCLLVCLLILTLPLNCWQ